MNRNCPHCALLSMLVLVGGVTIALLLWQMARLKVQPHVAPSAAQVAEPIVPAAAPQVVVLPEPERAPVEGEVVEPPPPPSVVMHPALANTPASWVDIERVLHDSVLAQGPAELQELAVPGADVWATLQAEHAFHERLRAVLREKPVSAPFSERKYWHQSRFIPWLDVELPLFVDQLHQLRVPAGAVDRFYRRMLEHR